MEEFLHECHKRIRQKYDELGYTLGYRFLLSPQRTLSPEIKLWFMGLNPGGSSIEPEQSDSSCEYGCAFYTESWKHKPAGHEALQIQVQHLFSDLCKVTHYQGSSREFADTQIMSSYFVPFRSPHKADLENKKEAFKFSAYFWNTIFQKILPTHIIALGSDVYKNICGILKMNSHFINEYKIKSNWGNYNLYLSKFKYNNDFIYVGNLLHLSTFKLYNHPESYEPLQNFIQMMNLPDLSGR